jgi:hypothetical protein
MCTLAKATMKVPKRAQTKTTTGMDSTGMGGLLFWSLDARVRGAAP